MSDIEVGKPKVVRRNPLLPREKLCPRCLQPLQRGSELGNWLITQDYYCTKCGYRGVMFLEADTDKTEAGDVSGSRP